MEHTVVRCPPPRLVLLVLAVIGSFVHPSAAAVEVRAEPKVVIVYGDSITAGAELAPGDRSRLWVLQVEAQSKGTLHTVNEGKGGRPTDSLPEFEAMLKRQPKASLLVIALGGNDARDISGNCVPNALTHLKAMVSRAREVHGKQLPILLVGPTNIRKDALGPSKPIGTQREANLRALNAAYAELAKTTNCAFVSLYGVLPDAGLGRDGVHPDAAGHDEIARVMLPAIALAASVTVSAAEPAARPSSGATIRLWDGPAPNAPAIAPEETTDKDGRVKNVSVPTLTAYLPDKAVATGTAIIVCSGGGYNQLAVKKHGEGAAAVFVPRGIAVFALKYRLQPISKNVVADACADGERALRMVRSRAREWNLDPQRIGILGYSAGANLILNVLSDFDDGARGSTDAIERQSSRPDFAGLFSPWSGGRKIGDFEFSKKTPPVYLAHTEDDSVAKVAFAREIEAKLKHTGVALNAEYFDQGGHEAFTIATGRHGDWPARFVPWLENEGLLAPLKGETKP